MLVAFPFHKLCVQKLVVLGLVEAVGSEDLVEVITDSVMFLLLKCLKSVALLQLLNKVLEQSSILLGEEGLLLTHLLLLQLVCWAGEQTLLHGSNWSSNGKNLCTLCCEHYS